MSGDPEAPSSRNTAARFAGVGLQFAVTLLLCLWLGTWLDKKFGTTPVFLYVGVFVGAAAAFYSMYRQLMANLERDERERRAAKSKGDDSSSGGAR
jgi:F0F1-type ATP synthase assembly protein I